MIKQKKYYFEIYDSKNELIASSIDSEDKDYMILCAMRAVSMRDNIHVIAYEVAKDSVVVYDSRKS